MLERALSPYVENGGAPVVEKRKITKTDLYLDGFSGTDGAAERRAQLLLGLGLPDDMSANSMLEALNILVGYDEYKRLAGEIL